GSQAGLHQTACRRMRPEEGETSEMEEARPTGHEHAMEQERPAERPALETATLGGGCFWCLEAVVDAVKGVREVVPGYAGGHRPDPTYEEVCMGRTGHAEVVRITFDPGVITYEEILEIFFAIHDPTTPNR